MFPGLSSTCLVEDRAKCPNLFGLVKLSEHLAQLAKKVFYLASVNYQLSTFMISKLFQEWHRDTRLPPNDRASIKLLTHLTV